MLLSGGLMAHRAGGATPSAGSLSTTSPSLTWQGAFYPFGVNADPAQCPPAADPLNLLCDHFFLNISLASSFWQSNTGTVTVTINWPSSSTSNDFDLFVYRESDGAQVGSSTLGGGETQEQVVLQAPIPGLYEVRVVPFLVIGSSYSGSAVLAFAPGGPTPNPSFLTGGIGFTTATIVDSQRTQGEPLVYIDQSGNIWETAPWGFSTAQGFVSKSTRAEAQSSTERGWRLGHYYRRPRQRLLCGSRRTRRCRGRSHERWGKQLERELLHIRLPRRR